MIRTKGEPGIAPCPRLVSSSSTDSDRSYETITELMTLQDQIDNFQKLIFSHFQGRTNNECRISALVPLVQESYGIYKFVTSMLRAMHTSTPASSVPLFPECSLLTALSHRR
jgi:ANTH domain